MHGTKGNIYTFTYKNIEIYSPFKWVDSAIKKTDNFTALSWTLKKLKLTEAFSEGCKTSQTDFCKNN